MPSCALCHWRLTRPTSCQCFEIISVVLSSMNHRNFVRGPMKLPLLFAVCLSVVLVAIRPVNSRAQERESSQTTPDNASSRTHAISEADSRAEQEAERLVSLPPE